MNKKTDEKLHEECGVFGIYDLEGADVASAIYYGLFSLQHRGQESCGIAVSGTKEPKGRVTSHKGLGLVDDVFSQEILDSMKGDIGIGHVRYSAVRAYTMENAQPLSLNYAKGTLALAHNGNLINIGELRQELEYTGAIFQSSTDSEVIAYYIARERLNSDSVEEAVKRACHRLKGSYALVVMSPQKLIGVRDPFGFKPLCIGKRGHAYIIASESCALETLGAEFVRDVLPGEIVTITPEGGIQSDTSMCLPKEKEARCIFEYIYFARPDSYIDGINVYEARIQAGKFLAIDSPVEADLVVGIPDSGNIAALGYSQESGIPYGTAFVKNNYVGRTFINPKQSGWESGIHVRLNVLKEVVYGKRIIIVDDSIVRGTMSDRIVNLLNEAGAAEVHMRISSPPFLWPCYFGTNVPARGQLIAFHRSLEEIRKVIGADSLAYLNIERLEQMVGGLPICKGCFSGEYPMKTPMGDIRREYQEQNLALGREELI